MKLHHMMLATAAAMALTVPAYAQMATGPIGQQQELSEARKKNSNNKSY